MTQQLAESGNSVIVYDDSILSQIAPEFFEPANWPDAVHASGQSDGRGGVLFVEHEGHAWVIRHYYRGGLAARLSRDRYLYTGHARTRPMREWAILCDLRAAGLPAPVPVAARYVRSGWWYTADLVTERLPDVQPLSRRLAEGPADAELWKAVGATIRRFHDAGFCHADLNAHNIQLGAAGEIYLLDWDRGRHRPPGTWREGNLARLRRSLEKIASNGAAYLPADFGMLQSGYAGG